MRIDGRDTRTIVEAPGGAHVVVLDQTRLPFEVTWRRLGRLDDVLAAIRTMVVRGAPLIGVTAAYGLAFALRDDATDAGLARAREALVATRPTAVNLAWAVGRVAAAARGAGPSSRAELALATARALADEDVATNLAIGRHGLALLVAAYEAAGRKRPVRVLTHCNAGALATVDHGTALAPVYAAVAAGIPVEVVADETRPRNQGARLTAFELAQAGVPCRVVADNASGHLLQRAELDLVLVGADRIAANGDVANKIGTYLKALAARDAGVPFHVAAPVSTIDPCVEDGLRGIPIEERGSEEVATIEGRLPDGRLAVVRLVPDGVGVGNPAFDVTPARLVTGLVTERGLVPATPAGIESVLRAGGGR